MSDKLTSNGLGKKPTRSAADHIFVTIASAQESALAKIREKAGHIIYTKWSREKQQNAALGLLDTVTSDQIKSDVMTIVDACNVAEAEILAVTATDIDDITDAEKQVIIDAADVAWPSI